MALRHRLIGVAARLYWRILKPRTLGVRCILLDGEGRIALVRHTFGDHWFLPGGGVGKGEGFDVALARELAEEIAVTAFSVERVLGVYHSRQEGKDDHVVVFVARTTSGPLAPADVAEVAEVGWFAADALPEKASPATARRVAEYRTEATGSGAW